MCLMCEYYEDSCDHPACVEAGGKDHWFTMRNGTRLYLWRGIGRPVCPEMVAKHAHPCACLVEGKYDECDCDA